MQTAGVCSYWLRRRTGAERKRARYGRSGGAVASNRQRTPTAVAQPDCDWPPRLPPRPAACHQLQHPRVASAIGTTA